MLIFLQKEGHSNLLLFVQYKKLTSNHGPQTFVAVRLKVILAVVTYIYEWGLGHRSHPVCHCAHCTVCYYMYTM